MELWQAIVSACAGLITLLTVLEKLGITGGIKKIEREFNELKQLNVHMVDMNKTQQQFVELQKAQNNALLGLLRNDLYQSFRAHRHHKIWTDDECSVQTKLHQAYKALQGNGEEELWWKAKTTWAIVSEEEYRQLTECPPNN